MMINKLMMMIMTRLWRLGICIWSLSVVCLIYTMFSQREYITIFTNDPRNMPQLRYASIFSNHSSASPTSRTFTQFIKDNTPSNIYHLPLLNGTRARLSGYNSIPLFLTSNGFNTGRLGNQMFMYASMLGIARVLNREPFISPGCLLDFTFKLRHLAEIPHVEGWRTVSETRYATFDKQLMATLSSKMSLHQNLTLSGYLQSWKYFMHIIPDIRTEFTFRSSVLRKRDQILKPMCLSCQENAVLVGVHVRRADLLLKQNIAVGYTIPKRSYFLKAFQWMRDTFYDKRVVFLVASDDLSWCENHLTGSDVLLMPPASQIVHLALLASCDHVIFSTGTFGWWGAWLAGGIGLFYKNYPAKETNLSIGFSIEDYMPHNWIGLND